MHKTFSRNGLLMRLFSLVMIFTLFLPALTGCSISSGEPTKLRDLEFTVVSEEVLPEELKALVEERKTGEFKITYTDADALYICTGYGEQPTGGYSITVDELYLAEDAIYISTSLLGPASGETPPEAPSYPYLVVKTELLDKTVVFE